MARFPPGARGHILGRMSEPAGGPRFLTVDEYRALELTSELRHEYVRGIIRAMTGASRRHNRIVGNVYRRLAAAADAGACRAYVNEVRVRVAHDVFYYPDVVVACAAPTVPCPELRLTLDEIYAGVERESDDLWPRPRRVREPEPQV